MTESLSMQVSVPYAVTETVNCTQPGADRESLLHKAVIEISGADDWPSTFGDSVTSRQIDDTMFVHFPFSPQYMSEVRNESALE